MPNQNVTKAKGARGVKIERRARKNGAAGESATIRMTECGTRR